MYKVIKTFADLEDGKHVYRVGDEYPRHGVKPSADRIKFLRSDQNLLHQPVIEEIKEEEQVEVAQEETKTEDKPKRNTRRTAKKGS